MPEKIQLALIWHQHQPFYEDLADHRAVLPWVRLHATKDYFDMAAAVEAFPGVRMTVNLVPSLLVQLENFASGRSTDPWMEKSAIPAQGLEPGDKRWILENFFLCNWETMTFPHPRFAELLERRGRRPSRETLERCAAEFSPQDFLDLQCWFNLAWMDPTWRDRDSTIGHLFKKQRGFSEGEKNLLLGKQKDICRLAIDKHRELWQAGRIEISTSPFYHPILPLLCDTDAMAMSAPDSPRPSVRFRRPEDAREQIRKALAYMENLMGRRPEGIWPSEGSVSEETAILLAEEGVRWFATDEAILFRSLALDQQSQPPKNAHHQPYRVLPERTGGRDLSVLFRDHALSDAIGFVYSGMDPEKAVEDFLGRILLAADRAGKTERPPLVPVILDGENCWEFYKNDGGDFLKALYSRLDGHPRIAATTPSEYLAKYPPKEVLRRLWSGSWINSDFSIWIGQSEDNRAWELLAEAREVLERTSKDPEAAARAPSIASAWESLYIAEGSDWCWWYGDQHSTSQDEVFDALYRTHLKNVYKFLGKEAPAELEKPIQSHQPRGMHIAPLSLISPKIDGLVTSFYEWRAGGTFETDSAGTTMQRADGILAALHYGFDMERLYVRLDARKPLESIDRESLRFSVYFLAPSEKKLEFYWPKGAPLHDPEFDFSGLIGHPEIRIAAKKVIEIAIPFQLLGASAADHIQMQIAVYRSGLVMERLPSLGTIKIDRPNEELGADQWSA
ncbi:MAG: hypothetical protein A2902_02265 [Elusimicrobia bacterium RIFCSPLOWO2_01_FULL_64_13]|nr:MAG: hypothetical protein A2636_07140 [Elusimicrobia bacterium RIFCSPHIGHO2_01_FULL_64_10]OGR94375.1 MAG: hypothetical protein A2902_02265 [Elusimicrobia bacterium RIFCSPLOWO2_01_FULL_64_13]